MGGSRDNPTVSQFRDALRQAMVSDVLNLRHPEGGNCEVDTAKFLFDLKAAKSAKLPSESSTSVSVPKQPVSSSVQTNCSFDGLIPQEQSSHVLSNNTSFYVAGVCVKHYISSVRMNHDDCSNICATFIQDLTPKFEHCDEIFTYLKAFGSDFNDDFGALHIPKRDFVVTVRRWDTIFMDNIDRMINQKNLIRRLKGLCSIVNLSWFPNSEACREKLMETMEYFLRIRIYYVLKTLNQIIQDSPKNKENRKYKKLANL